MTNRTLHAIDLDGLFPRYGYPNDLLARLWVGGARVLDVPVRMIYGSAWRSGILFGRTAIHPVLFCGAAGAAVAAVGSDATARRTGGEPVHVGVVTTSYPRFSGDSAGGFVHGLNLYLRRCDIGSQ